MDFKELKAVPLGIFDYLGALTLFLLQCRSLKPPSGLKRLIYRVDGHA